MKILFLAFLVLLPYLTLTKEIRATWIDTSQCPNETTTAELIKILHENGVNRVYVDTWQNGKVFYRSKTMLDAIGEQGIGQMMIPWFVKYAKPLGMEVYGWFEFGYMAAMRNINIPCGLYALSKGWIMGECDEFYYMDIRTNATEFLIGLLADSIEVGLDGVQFDDHFACPPKFPQCSSELPVNAAKYIKDRLKKKFGDKMVPMSIAPAPMPEALRDYRVDWRKMMLKGYYDELVPLLYTNNFEYYKSKFAENEPLWAEYKSKVLIGIMVNGDGSFILTDWKVVVQMIKYANDKGYSVVIWYGKSIAKDYRKQFHDLWGRKTLNQ